MRVLARHTRGTGRPGGETVAALLRPGYGAEAFARFCGAEAHWIERMHFSANKPLSLHCRVRLPGGMEQTVLAEWVGPEAVSFAQAEIERLQKARRGQLAKGEEKGLLGDAASGLVLRRPGLDGRLPGLRLLHNRQVAGDFAWPGSTGRAVNITLRGHRLGKRAVLQVDRLGAGPRQVFVKLRPVSSTAGRRAYDRHRVLSERLGGSVAIPKPLGFNADLGAAVFSALRGTSPDFMGDQPALVAGALRRLQEITALPVERYSAAEELMLLRTWCERVSAAFPERAEVFYKALGRVRRDLLHLPDTDPVPCHRDFHEGQILIDGERAGFLDFDTLRLGDPALDPGNLIAHLRLTAIRCARANSDLEGAIINAMHPLAAGRISAWTRAAQLRLAAIYSFTSEPRETLQRLLEDVLGDRCPGKGD